MELIGYGGHWATASASTTRPLLCPMAKGTVACLDFLATVCKTVRPIGYQTVVFPVLSVYQSVTLVSCIVAKRLDGST